MASLLQLTEQQNPAAQTFIVDQDQVLTGVGLYFAKAEGNFPITIELRPTGESGTPSAKRFIPGTRVTASASAVASVADPNTFSSAREYKFTFREPVFIPGNSLLAVCIYTAAPVGNYQFYTAVNGDLVWGNTTKRYSAPTETADGGFYSSSNGTTWQADNNKDLAFKIYKAQFTKNYVHRAKIIANNPPMKALTEITEYDDPARYTFDPLVFTSGADSIGVIHPAHGFQVGDKVVLEPTGTDFDSSSTAFGVSGSSIFGTRTITKVDPFGYNIAIDSASDSTGRAGGLNLIASQQINLDQYKLDIPYISPPDTVIRAKGNFTTTKGYAGSETAYNSQNGVKMKLNRLTRLPAPMIVASKEQETLRLSGNNSTEFEVQLDTNNVNVAPHFNINSSRLSAEHYFVDYQDSASTTNRNLITTIPFVPETSPDGGTTASKHITVPYYLFYASTSIVVLVDAIKPAGADFSVWYRTKSADDSTKLRDKNWVEFSKNTRNSLAGGGLYSEIGSNEDVLRMREYEFSVFNLPAFNEYQIKITFNTTRQTYPPAFENLRTIATV